MNYEGLGISIRNGIERDKDRMKGMGRSRGKE